MEKLSIISSQRPAHEEHVQEDIWDETEEDIWAEIFHDSTGNTFLKNIASGNPSRRQRKVQTIDFEDYYLQVNPLLLNY